MTKGATVQSVQQAAKWKSFEINEPEMRMLDEQYVVLIYTTLAYRADDSEYRAHIATTYRKEDGGWKLLVHQQTPLFT